jgi:hypothetical protein
MFDRLPVPGRVAVALLLGSYIVAAPAARQVFDVRSDYLRAWVMFSGAARDVCVADFRVGGQDGRRLDRFAVLGMARGDAPKSVVKMADADVVKRVARRMCEATGEDVRVQARCATRTGWKRVLRWEDTPCNG